MQIINTRQHYMRKEFEAGRIFNNRKAMASRCPICGEWIDRSSLSSIKTEDLWEGVRDLSPDTLKEMWVLTPYCVACMG